jgi:hypothetical protein
MLISKNKKSSRRFGDETLVYLVPELCVMTGITDAMRYLCLNLTLIIEQYFFFCCIYQ